ncbi:MAG: tRNA epoxyqueuosine(34) reductase QueG [Delftia sp.]|nr:tRNA epoxyqueuosine(34) reductase QueG [Delftia sp.]
MSQRIKDHARALGFDLVGLTPAAPSQHARFYARWLDQGYAADMAYLARPDAVAKRSDPRRIMPGARSVLMVALNYYQVQVQPPAAGQRGRVSRYAWGDDYHALMWSRLDQLADLVQIEAGKKVAQRRYVDTGPLLERELAARAGLGWFGKNTMLINPRFGSWLFLGALLLDLELDYDAPLASDRCGSCSRCIQACPTRCILPGRTLDASRCISYLTIELKRAGIPAELRPLVGDWVLGCDVCQDVCPWNRFARQTGEAAFGPRPGIPRPDLNELLALDEDEFRRRFRGSPIKRARLGGLQRNAAVALENVKAARSF